MVDTYMSCTQSHGLIQQTKLERIGYVVTKIYIHIYVRVRKWQKADIYHSDIENL